MRGYESPETYGKDAESRRSLIWSDIQMEKTPHKNINDSQSTFLRFETRKCDWLILSYQYVKHLHTLIITHGQTAKPAIDNIC